VATRLVNATATGVAQAGPCWLKSATLTAAGAAATLDIRDGASGAILKSLAAPIGSTVSWTCGDEEGVWFSASVHATLTGASASASFEVEV